MRNICYHTRLHKDPKVKCCGGTFGGQVDAETIERLIKYNFDVKILPSGRLIFVDKEGRDVLLFISVDPESTSKGKNVLQEYQKQKRIEEEKQEKIEQEQNEEIEELTKGLSHEEIIKRLKG
ncbi:hypothetical protein KLEP7_gp73 [Pseudaeromonas phage vB_PpeM_ KLEP7]|nr:hypothetical protein KLEP7_gp73 [Pseudaeromonas phage vB_PpeM_ KLEP7]